MLKNLNLFKNQQLARPDSISGESANNCAEKTLQDETHGRIQQLLDKLSPEQQQIAVQILEIITKIKKIKLHDIYKELTADSPDVPEPGPAPALPTAPEPKPEP